MGTPTAFIPQYLVPPSAVKKAKLEGSLFKFVVKQFRNPSNSGIIWQLISFQLHVMTFALPSVLEAILNPEFKKCRKIW